MNVKGDLLMTIIYPVKDLARAKALFTNVLGTKPANDAPYYVGFKVGADDVGLDPNGHRDGAVAYFPVSDIRASIQQLVANGAKLQQDAKDVGGGRLIASLKDADGNLIGLMQG